MNLRDLLRARMAKEALDAFDVASSKGYNEDYRKEMRGYALGLRKAMTIVSEVFAERAKKLLRVKTKK